MLSIPKWPLGSTPAKSLTSSDDDDAESLNFRPHFSGVRGNSFPEISTSSVLTWTQSAPAALPTRSRARKFCKDGMRRECITSFWKRIRTTSGLGRNFCRCSDQDSNASRRGTVYRRKSFSKVTLTTFFSEPKYFIESSTWDVTE